MQIGEWLHHSWLLFPTDIKNTFSSVMKNQDESLAKDVGKYLWKQVNCHLLITALFQGTCSGYVKRIIWFTSEWLKRGQRGELVMDAFSWVFKKIDLFIYLRSRMAYIDSERERYSSRKREQEGGRNRGREERERLKLIFQVLGLFQRVEWWLVCQGELELHLGAQC